MAKIKWSERALEDLYDIAEYIAYDDPEAAGRFVANVFRHVDHLERHPKIGPLVMETGSSLYRQIVEPPCRIFYRVEGDAVYIVHVLRFERLLRMSRLEDEAG